jgi:hypothetical protein
VILIVHGAWHNVVHYRGLINVLKEQHYTVIAPPLATSGYDDSIDGKTIQDDADRIHKALLPYLNEGKTAIVVSHSYGAIPAIAATVGHSVAERSAKGLRGGIVALFYVAGIPFAAARNMSLYEGAGSQWLPFHGADVSKHCLHARLLSKKFKNYFD